MRPGADRYTPDDTADRPTSSAGSGFTEAYRVHRPGLVKLATFIVGDGVPVFDGDPTRFYQFTVTSTGHVTGLRVVGKTVTGEPVSEFAASPDGTRVAYAVRPVRFPTIAAQVKANIGRLSSAVAEAGDIRYLQ